MARGLAETLMADFAASVDQDRRDSVSKRHPGDYPVDGEAQSITGFCPRSCPSALVDRRRGHPTHTFVLPPRHVRRGRELAYREMLPTDENIRLSPVLVTPIVLTSCNLPERQALLADNPTSKPNPWGTTSSPTPRGMNDDLTSSIYRYPCRIPEHCPMTSAIPVRPGPRTPPQVRIRSKQQVS